MFFYKWNQRKAVNNFVRGNYEKAELQFQRLLEENPNKVGIRHNLALVKLALKKPDEALKLLYAELDRFGGDYHRHRALGDANYLCGNAAEAAKWYVEAEKEPPAEREAVFIRRRIKICRDPEAFAGSQEAFRLFDEANRTLKEEDQAAAAEKYRESISKDPTNFMARNNLGTIYMNTDKDYDKAMEQFTAALKYTNLPLIQRNLQLCKNQKKEAQ